MKTSKINFSIISAGIILASLLSVLSNTSVQKDIANLLGLENSYTATENQNNETAHEQGIYKVDRVVDGDTVILSNGIRVRYLNMDTPESVKPNTPVQCYAKESSQMNKSLVEGKEVVVTYDKEKRDRYGRDLVFVFIKGSDTTNIKNSINAMLVQSGYARAYIIKPNDTYKDEFYSLQREAQDKNLGIWKNCPNPFEE